MPHLETELARVGVDPYGLFIDLSSNRLREQSNGRQSTDLHIDRENRQPAPHWFFDEARKYLEAPLPDLDAVILSDYGKGVLIDPLLGCHYCHGPGKRAVPPAFVWTPKDGSSRYLGPHSSPKTAKKQNWRWATPCTAGRTSFARPGTLPGLWPGWHFNYPGSRGYGPFSKSAPAPRNSAQAREVFDVSGAGDPRHGHGAGSHPWRQPLLAADWRILPPVSSSAKLAPPPCLRSATQHGPAKPAFL